LVPRASLDAWIAHLSAELPTIAFSCGAPDKIAGAGGAAAEVKKVSPRVRPARVEKEKRHQFKGASVPEVVAKGAASAAPAAAGESATAAVGIDALAAVLRSRQAALSAAATPESIAKATAMPVPELSVGIVGFERAGKRALLKVVRTLNLGGISWLERPALLNPLGGGGGVNDVLLRRCPPEHVPQPEAIVEAILDRCERRPLLRHFAQADFEDSTEFLGAFARANGLPEPRPLPGHSRMMDARASALGWLRYLSIGRLPFCTRAPAAAKMVALPPTMVAAGWKSEGCAVAAAAEEVIVVEMSAGEPDEIDLEEPEILEDMEEGEEEGEEEEGEEEEGEEEEGEEEEGEEEEDDDDEEEEDEEEGGMPLAPPSVEAILKGTSGAKRAAAAAAPPSKKGKSTHETAQPTAPPPKPAPLAAAKPAAPAPAPASKGGFVKIAGGVEYEDVQLGAMSGGVARNGQKVTVKYVGTLTNGKRFDAGDISFRLGAGEVIKGWDLGVAGMRVGGKRKLRIPPDAAYGKRGAPPTIPPNATLLFDVELKRC
jgi:FK506-binding nuclear protein